MTHSRRWSLGAAVGPEPRAAGQRVAAERRGSRDRRARAGKRHQLGGLLGPVGDALASIGGSVLDGGVAQTLSEAVVPAASNPCSQSGSLKKSSNGSVTVLLLGSDYRRSPYIGERTDTVIVMNVGKNGRVSMAAIPRDTVRIPLASGGTSGSRRVNALYIGYKRSSVGRHGVDCRALDKVRKDIAKTLGTYIPYYALIRMDQFQSLIDRVGGIQMNIRGTLIDYHYSRNSRKVYVPKRDDYQMNGGGNCGKKPTLCRNALKYARSRYGTEGGTSNSDFRRVRRQQEIVFYAIKRVLNRGNGSNLSSLLSARRRAASTATCPRPRAARSRCTRSPRVPISRRRTARCSGRRAGPRTSAVTRSSSSSPTSVNGWTTTSSPDTTSGAGRGRSARGSPMSRPAAE